MSIAVMAPTRCSAATSCSVPTRIVKLTHGERHHAKSMRGPHDPQSAVPAAASNAHQTLPRA
jgi:hypothetical protein